MNPEERLQRSVERSLASLPGELARVVYLASLRDAYNGRYLHEGLATLADPQQVHEILRARHIAAFNAASALPLDGLCTQLQEHFASVGVSPQTLAKMWLELEPFRDIFPAGSSELEREFFISQMRAALKVLAASLTMATPSG